MEKIDIYLNMYVLKQKTKKPASLGKNKQESTP